LQLIEDQEVEDQERSKDPQHLHLVLELPKTNPVFHLEGDPVVRHLEEDPVVRHLEEDPVVGHLEGHYSERF
jgi:hypothetical protein